MHYFKQNFLFNIVFRFGFEFYLQLFFASAYNLYVYNDNDAAEKYSVFISVLWIILLMSILLTSILYLIIFRKNYTQEGIKNSRLRILLEDFKDNKKHLILDHIAFMIRRILLSFLIIFGWSHGFIQDIAFICICLVVVIMKICMRPFRYILLNIQDFIFEFVLLMVIGIFITFKEKSTLLSETGTPNILGIIWFSLVWFLMIINLIFYTAVTIAHIYHRRSLKSRVLNISLQNDSNTIIKNHDKMMIISKKYNIFI